MINILIPTTKERRERLNQCIDSILESDCPYPFSITTYESEKVGWVKAVSQMIEGVNGLVFILASDNIVDKGCIKTLYEKYTEVFPNNDGILQPDDSQFHNSGATMPFGHSAVIKKYLNLNYYHYYADFEIAGRATNDEKYLFVPEAKVTHNHYMADKTLMDDTYRHALSFQKKDKEYFDKRAREDFIV